MSALHNRIKELRANGMGLLDAKRVATREDLEFEIALASTIEDVKAILYKLAAR